MRVHAGGTTLDGVTVIVQNRDPFTYFRRRPIRVAEPAGLETGSLSVAVLGSATPLEVPTHIRRLLSARAKPVLHHRRVKALGELSGLRVDAIDNRPFPVQVDGDYIAEYGEVQSGIKPGGHWAVA